MVQNGNTFGGLLRRYRKRAHITQKELSGAIGVPQPTLSAWERGDWKPRFDEPDTQIAELARALKLDEAGSEALVGIAVEPAVVVREAVQLEVFHQLVEGVGFVAE